MRIILLAFDSQAEATLRSCASHFGMVMREVRIPQLSHFLAWEAMSNGRAVFSLPFLTDAVSELYRNITKEKVSLIRWMNVRQELDEENRALWHSLSTVRLSDLSFDWPFTEALVRLPTLRVASVGSSVSARESAELDGHRRRLLLVTFS